MTDNSTIWRRRLIRLVVAALVSMTVPSAMGSAAAATDDSAAFVCAATDGSVSWTSTDATNYYVRRDLGDGSVYVGSSTGLSFDTDARYGVFSVISYAGGRRVASCEGPGGPTAPSHDCAVDGSTLSWTDQGVSRYFLRREVDGVDGYLGTTTGLSYDVDPVGIYTVVTWTRGVKSSIRCAGTVEDRLGPDLLWKTNNTKSPFSMNLLRGTSDPRGDLLSAIDVQVVSGAHHFVTVDGNRLSVDPRQVVQAERVVFSYDIVGDPGVVYRSTATIDVAFVNDEPIDADEQFFADSDEVLDERTGLHMTIEGVGGFDFGDFGGAAVSPNGKIYVVDTRNHRVQICNLYDPCATFGGFGDRPGKFYFPASIAVDGDRNLWIGDAGNGRIQKCNRNGTGCEVVAFDVVSTGSPTPDVGPVYAIGFADADHIVFSRNSDLVRCDVDGTTCAVLELDNTTSDDVITQIAVQPDGRTFIGTAAGTLATCVDILDAVDPGCVGNSAPSNTLPGVPIDALVGVAIDPTGRLVVSDVQNQRLLTCDARGVRCDPLNGTDDGSIATPRQLAIDRNGLIFVVDAGLDVVQVFARRGVLINATDGDDDPLSVSAVAGEPSAVGVPTLTGLGALVTIDADGGVTYDPMNSAPLQALRLGESIEDVVSYTVSDGRGGAATSQLTIRVTGRHSI